MKTRELIPKARAAVKKTLRLKLPPRGVPKAKPRPVVPLPPIALPAHLKRRLLALSRRHWIVANGTGVAMLIATICALIIGQTFFDWLFDIPWLARAGFLVGDAVLLGWIYRKYLHATLRQRLNLAKTALLVEKKWSKFRQGLITAVEMSEGKSQATRGSRQLIDVLMEQVSAKSLDLDFKEVVPGKALRRWTSWAVAAAVILAAGTVVFWPSSEALLQRLILLNVPLPTKTIVVPITKDLSAAIGGNIELVAQAKGVIPIHGRLMISYADSNPLEIPLTVLPDRPGVFSYTVRNVQKDFHYQFLLNDGRGPEFTVTSKPAPSIQALECTEVFPTYTKLPPAKLEPSNLSLLEGSHLRLVATPSEPLKTAVVILQGISQKIDMAVEDGGKKLEADIPIPAKDLTGMSLHLVNGAGFTSTDETIYPIVLVPDNPPVVTITEPKDVHETLTLRAKPTIAFEASDDYGLSKLNLVYQLIPPLVVDGGPIPPAPTPVTIPIKLNAHSDNTHYETVLDVALQNPPWKEGWTVNYWIEAADNNTATGPGITKTDPKQFGILSAEAKEAEILQRMKDNASTLDGLFDNQQNVIKDVGNTLPQK